MHIPDVHIWENEEKKKKKIEKTTGNKRTKCKMYQF